VTSIRCFIAVFLDPALRSQVAAVERHLAQSGADVKWVEPENLHFTVKFLGDVEESRLLTIGGVLRACMADTRPFEMDLGALGAFPGMRDPRVIWVGVNGGREPFVALARAVEEAMKAEGFRREGKGTSPHLTIGRVRSGRNLDALVDRLSTGSPLDGSMMVDRVQLTASELTNRGPLYRPVEVVTLV